VDIPDNPVLEALDISCDYAVDLWAMSFPGLGSTFGCTSRKIGGHIHVGKPKRVVCRDIGLPSHHAITNIVSAIKKKQ
jgi:hypothetical protein